MNYNILKIINIDLNQDRYVKRSGAINFSYECKNLKIDSLEVNYTNVVTGETFSSDFSSDNFYKESREIKVPSFIPDGVYDLRVRKEEPVIIGSRPYRIIIGQSLITELKTTYCKEKPVVFGTLQAISPAGECIYSPQQKTISFVWEHNGSSPLCYQLHLIDEKTGKSLKIWRGLDPHKNRLEAPMEVFNSEGVSYRWRVLAVYPQKNIRSEDVSFTLSLRFDTNQLISENSQNIYNLSVDDLGRNNKKGPKSFNNERVVALKDVGVCFRKPDGVALKKMHFNIKSLFRSGRQEEKFWALRNISFELQHGEILGVIGNNGAGKSTLLKVLTGVLLPDTGSVHMKGRVSSLLALGAGFMPYLSGRENIFLNGMYMGMSREKINAIFDEIVAFSELEDFIDTPIRYYSSGMKARLGFSVAVHVEPEILVVDEVLATGDKHFRVKAKKKMEAFMEKAKVLIIASHSMRLITDLTQKCLYLEKGKIKQLGPTDEVVASYNFE